MLRNMIGSVLLVVGIVVYVVPTLIALVRLGHRQIDEVARVLWAFLIVGLPLLGAIAFFLVQPGGVTDTA